MAGLLNGGGFDDPLTMGLLGASQALMTPMAQGGGMGAAFNAFPAAQQQAMRQQYLRQQMEGQQSEAELRKMQILAAQEKARREAAQLATRQGILGNIAVPQQMGFRDANIAMSGVAPAGYQPPGQRNPITQADVAQWVSAGGDPDVLKKLAESRDWGRAEVARTLDVFGPNNKPQTRREDKFGDKIGDDVDKPFEMKLADLGGSLSPYNPFAPPSSFAKTMAPGERERLDLTRRGQNMVDDRSRDAAAATFASGKWTNLADQGLQVNMATGETRPIMAGGVPLGAKPEKATDGEKLAAGYGSRMVAAERDLAAYDSTGRPTLGREIAANAPLTGGKFGPYVRTEDQQLYRQAQEGWVRAKLRKESGAVIGAEEMESEIRNYFPQPGQPESVAKQKAASRAQAVAAMKVAAGSVPFPTLPPTSLGGNRAGGNVKFDELPNASQFRGKTIRDDATGELLVSDGFRWGKP